MIQLMNFLLEIRLLELTSRGHPNCLRAEWGYLSTAEIDKSQDGGRIDQQAFPVGPEEYLVSWEVVGGAFWLSPTASCSQHLT